MTAIERPTQEDKTHQARATSLYYFRQNAYTLSGLRAAREL